MDTREAACACRQFRIRCEGEPVRVSMCHCLDCQRRTGSSFGVQAWFPLARVGAPVGTGRRYVRQAESGRAVTFNFCSACGGTVLWHAEQRPDLVAVPVGAFADPGFPAPRHSVWEKRRHAWTVAIGNEPMDHSD